MTEIPQYFTQPPANAIASYNYTDIDEGTGVVIYYGASISGSGILTRYPIYSEIYGGNGAFYGITTPSAASAASTYTEQVTKNFDVVFNAVPKIIKGNMHIIVPVGSSGNGVRDIYTMEEIYKLDTAGAATLILSGCSQVFKPDVNGVFSGNTGMTFVVPQTSFAVGEGLRIKIRLWALNEAAGSTVYAIGHDPQNRNDPNSTFKAIADTTDTVMQVHVPFKISIP